LRVVRADMVLNLGNQVEPPIPSANSLGSKSRTLTKSVNSLHPAQMKRSAKSQLPKWRQRTIIDQRQLRSISISALEIRLRSLTNDEASTGLAHWRGICPDDRHGPDGAVSSRLLPYLPASRSRVLPPLPPIPSFLSDLHCALSHYTRVRHRKPILEVPTECLFRR
jgi:hypothetical protein